MTRYAITEKAGRFVAAHRNTGVGTVLELTEKQAEHELRLGSLVALDATPAHSSPPAVLPPAPERAERGQLSPEVPVSETAPRRRRRKR